MKIKARFEAESSPRQAPSPTPVASEAPPPTGAARNLALAYYIDRLIERGLIADFTAAARMLGISQPGLTHVMSLMLLAPEIQEVILLGEMHLGDKELRALARITDWEHQAVVIQRRPYGLSFREARMRCQRALGLAVKPP